MKFIKKIQSLKEKIFLTENILPPFSKMSSKNNFLWFKRQNGYLENFSDLNYVRKSEKLRKTKKDALSFADICKDYPCVNCFYN